MYMEVYVMAMSERLCVWVCSTVVVAMPLVCTAGDVGWVGRGEGGLISSRPGNCQVDVRGRERNPGGWNGIVGLSAAAMEGGSAAAHFRHAEALSQAGRLDAALSSYTLAITIDPDHAGALQGRWKLCSRLSLHRQALKDLSRLIELMPGRAEYHYERGRMLLKLNSVREAYRDFLRAYELDRRYPRPTLLEDDVPTGKILVAERFMRKVGELKPLPFAPGGRNRFKVPGRVCADA